MLGDVAEKRDRLIASVVSLSTCVSTSETEYRVGRRHERLPEWHCVTSMRERAASDVRLFTLHQLTMIDAGIRSGKYVCDTAFACDFEGDALDDTMTHDIYVWRCRRSAKGYVGKIERNDGSTRRKCDCEHRRNNDTKFDQQLSPDDQDQWECVSVVDVSSRG